MLKLKDLTSQHADVCELPDRLLIHPVHYAEPGFLIAAGPYVTLNLDAPPEEVGAAVLGACSKSKGILPAPKDFKAHSAPRLEAAGVKSELGFQRKAKLVSVEITRKEITLQPFHNGGTAGAGKGFHGKSENRILLPVNIEDQSLGQQIRVALSRCT